MRGWHGAMEAKVALRPMALYDMGRGLSPATDSLRRAFAHRLPRR